MVLCFSVKQARQRLHLTNWASQAVSGNGAPGRYMRNSALATSCGSCGWPRYPQGGGTRAANAGLVKARACIRFPRNQ